MTQMMHVFCARCQQKTAVYAQVLWMGPRGFRRYILCPSCEKTVKDLKQQKRQSQIVGGTK